MKLSLVLITAVCICIIADVNACHHRCTRCDCAWGSWGAWSSCTGCSQRRTRSIARQAACGGSQCTGPSREYRTCGAVNCAWENWGAWSSCNGCSQRRGRSKAMHAACGGSQCTGPSREYRNCGVVNCDWGNWGEWSPCNECTQTRNRSISISAACGGSQCIGSMTDQMSCSMNCVWGSWGEWSSCSATCGVGTETRSRVIMSEACGNGEQCAGQSEEHRTCNPGCTRGTPAEGSCTNCPQPYTGNCCEDLITDGDPCTSHFELNEPWRSINHEVVDNNFYCYTGLINHWYRFTGPGGGEMPTSCVKTESCGVLKPIWLHGNHPNEQQGVVTRKICASKSTDNIQGCCVNDGTIQIKNCGNYFVYKLFQPQNCTESFCAGEEAPCPEGTTSPNGYSPNCMMEPPDNSFSPTLTYNSEDDSFVCSFEESVPEADDIQYKLKWYIDETTVVEKTFTGNSDKMGLSSMNIGSGNKMIKCSLTAKYVSNTGTAMSEESERKSSGINYP